MSTPSHSANVTRAPTAEQERLLDERLDGLRAASESLAAPAHLEEQLLAAFRAHQATHDATQRASKRRGEIIAQWFAPGIALAASVGMSAWMVLAPMARPMLDRDAPAAASTRMSAEMNAQMSAPMFAQAFADTPFIALQSLEQIALEPQPRLLEADVPRAWLAAYGVPVNPEMAGDSMRAEMLVSTNGQPLAMRFLP